MQLKHTCHRCFLTWHAARMGLILDSSIVIAAERRGDTVVQLIQNIVKVAGSTVHDGC